MLFFPKKREGKREDQAEQDARSDGNIKGKTSLSEKDIARKLSKHRNFRKNSREDPHADQDHAKENQCLCQVAHAHFPMDFL